MQGSAGTSSFCRDRPTSAHFKLPSAPKLLDVGIVLQVLNPAIPGRLPR